MKLQCILLLTAAAALPAQSPSKPKPASNPAPAKAAAPAPGSHATLADLRRDFEQKKLAAIEAYVKTHATATDANEALIEGAQIAKGLDRTDDALRLGEKPMREAIANAGSDINKLVEMTTMLAEILVAAGKKDAAIELLKTTGESHSEIKGLAQHFEGIAKNYELIGSDPLPIDKEDTAGKKIDLAEYKGKVVLVDFWATWCGPCVGEMPHVIAAYDKYHDKGFEIVGISLDQDREKMDKFVADKGMKWRQYFDGKGWQNEVSTAWGVSSIPATYLVGADGKVLEIGLRGDALAQKLEKLLGGKAAATPAAAPKK